MNIRVASYNASLNRSAEGELVADLSSPGDTQAQAVAEIIQRNDADIILVNEFDYDAEGKAADLFRSNYLSVGQNGAEPVEYPYVYVAPSNTGVPSGLDLDNSGAADDSANDAYGFGEFEGQYGFVVYSKYPIDTENVRSFQKFLWKDMPGNLLTEDPAESKLTDYYSPEEVAALRLSSKNHVDVPVEVDGETVHVLAAHPTPPVFDGEEDRNGKRNHDEIRFWSDYVEGAAYIEDDTGQAGGLEPGARFVIVGDYNADPFDGDSYDGAANQLLDNPLITGSATDPAITPASDGAVAASERQNGVNDTHAGNPAFDTADFGFNAEDPSSDVAPGNSRVDYALPSKAGFAYLGGGVTWVTEDDPLWPVPEYPTSDHRLVYADLAITGENRVKAGAPDLPGDHAAALDIMLVNDDGYDAAGLAAMRDALIASGHSVTVVAPLEQQSGNGTALDADLGAPVAVTEFRPGDYNVAGSPVVTTLAGLEAIFGETAPDLVVSGINAGANVGDIALNSGTVSAAVTAILRGIPTVAISANGAPADDLAAAQLVNALVGDMAERAANGEAILPEGTGLNVNVPTGWEGEIAYTDVSGLPGFRIAVTPAEGGDGDDVTIGSEITGPVGAEDSEGVNFTAGKATISVMDGNWSTDEATRAALEARLGDLNFETPSEAGEALDIMLVNDDGYDAEGLIVMAEALRAAGHTVRIVAPAEQQSGQGTTLDIENFGQIVEVTEFAPGDYNVATSPWQVTRAGLDVILADTPPDLVVSGINEGQNVGATAISSGTVSAAVSALQTGIPAIAVSAGIDLAEAEAGFPSTASAYEAGARVVTDLIADLIATKGEGPLLPEGAGLSVNVPTGEIGGVSFTRLDEASPLQIGFGDLPGGGQGITLAEGEGNGDPLSEGSEYLAGNITVTPIDGNYTAEEPLRSQVEELLAAGADLTALTDGPDGDFLGHTEIASGTGFEGTVIGGLSGITYNPATGTYLAISDDREAPRYYELEIDLSDGMLRGGDVEITSVTELALSTGEGLGALSPDPEGIALGAGGQIHISSERNALGRYPEILKVGDDGVVTGALPVDGKFEGFNDAKGVRENLGFESLAITPDRQTLWTATESALTQDGDVATTEAGAAARLIRFDLETGEPVAEHVYEVEPIAQAPEPADAFADSGLVDLIALDDQGTLLALERSFSTGAEGRGFSGKLFLVETQGATDVSGTDALPFLTEDGETALNVDAPVKKTLLADLDDLGITLDNIEGMTLGPRLADGRQSLVIVSDDNFSGFGPQASQFIALGLDLKDVPTLAPVLETPDEPRYDSPADRTEGPDPDDPAIWRHPEDAGESVVITAMKEGGLRVYDLQGEEMQRIEPEGIRYNNVDVLYDVGKGRKSADLAIASDRANDTLAIFRIGEDGTLAEATSKKIPGSIFGVDDGEATAYGLAAYTSPKDGKDYVFVTQADGSRIAQLELVGKGKDFSFETVRMLDLPVPEGEDAADYQSEGIVIDAETGRGYVAVETELGLLGFDADPAGSDRFDIIAPIESPALSPDIEGVSLHYGEDGEGLILVSSQGDSTFAVFDRKTEDYRGSFALRGGDGIDGVEESDGAAIHSGALPGFGDGLLVTQDGSNEPQMVFPEPGEDGGEVQNWNATFKYTDLGDVLGLFGMEANAGYDPRAMAGGDTMILC